MSIRCNHCEGTGFLNIHQVDSETLAKYISKEKISVILVWMMTNSNHDVQVCNCCGDGLQWYGEPGEHYRWEDPPGDQGPYAYNGGLCECH